MSLLRKKHIKLRTSTNDLGLSRHYIFVNFKVTKSTWNSATTIFPQTTI